jgi:hypothetical protein
MLTIRPGQLETLLAPHRESFVQQARVSLARLFPDDPRLGDPEVIRSVVLDAISRASAYGIEAGREVLLFLFLIFERGPGFESRPGQSWMERTLRDEQLDQSEKMSIVYARLRQSERTGQS